MIVRHHAEARLRTGLSRAPVVLLTGPRQAGKSTLAREVVRPEARALFDLEDPRDVARLSEPTLALAGHDETIIIDEAQLRPDLFPILRVLVDEDRRPARFLVLGSASPDLTGLTSDSLAGRVAFVELQGFALNDVGAENLQPLWVRGGLPESFLVTSEDDSNQWRDDYITTFLQRDLAALGFGMPASTMRRFWSMLAHYHGQTWNAAEIARSIDISQTSVRRYVDALTDALVVRQLPAWHANVKKRQIKAPRVFIRDSGLLHRLLGIGSMLELDRHPKLGASWEGLVVEHLATREDVRDSSYWATHAGAELDLRLDLGGRIIGVEIKRTDAPRTTKSMHAAIETLDLDHLYVVHGGQHRYPLTPQITAVPAIEVLLSPTAGPVFASP